MPKLPIGDRNSFASDSSNIYQMNQEQYEREPTTANNPTASDKKKKFKSSGRMNSEDSGISLRDTSNKNRKPSFPDSLPGDERGYTNTGFSDGYHNVSRRKSQWQSIDWKSVVQSGTFKHTLSQLARDGETDVLSNILGSMPTEKCRRILNNYTDDDGTTALHLAARNNHFDICELLMKSGANVNCRAVSRATPLHFAARYQQKKSPGEGADDDTRSVIRLLCEFGAQVNAVDFEGLSPLHYASVKGNSKAVKNLLSCDGINIELKDHQGMTAMHVAATHGQFVVVKQLIDKGGRLDATDNDQMTPLHFACSEGIVEIVKHILKTAQELDKNLLFVKKIMSSADAGKNTCLHVAVTKGHEAMVSELIEWSGKILDTSQFVNMPRSHGDTPLHIAASQGFVRICQILLMSNANVNARNNNLSTPLLLAAQHDHFEVVELLLENGSDLENRDKDNLTALLVASKHGHIETLTWLIENGADASASDKNDKNCLMLAVEENRRSAVEELLEYNSIKNLISETDINANSVLHLAAVKGFTEIIKIFLDHNVRMDLKNEDEATPLHMAAQYGQDSVVKELLDHDKGTINAVNENANTALHMAAMEGHTKCLKTLLEQGANVGLRNTRQWTALDCACSGGFERCVVALLNAGAAVNPPVGVRTTPLHQACLNGHVQVVNLLLEWRADLGATTTDKRNALDCAIDKDNDNCVEAILNHPLWKNAMRNSYLDPITGQITTPLRKLIIKMPDMAEVAFSRCIVHNRRPLDHPRFEVTLDYEFLDDMYLITEWLHKNKTEEENEIEENKASTLINTHVSTGKTGESPIDIKYSMQQDLKLQVPPDPLEYVAFSDKGRLTKHAITYTSDANQLRHNHPLMIMVSAKRESLLQHPVVTSLLLYKWNKYGGLVYYCSLLFLLVFVGLLNFYMVSVPAPYTIDYLKSFANRRFYNEFTAKHLINYTAPSPTYSILDLGITYRGYKNTTKSGLPCLRWEDTRSNSRVYPDDGLVENYCRNPGTAMGSPWCFTNYSEIDASGRIMEECDVPKRPIYASSSSLPFGSTCHFPFLYKGVNTTSCLARSSGDWCGVTADYDEDRKWGYCTDQDPHCDVPEELKTPCGSPGTDKLNCEARGCCFYIHDEGLITEHTECYQSFASCSDRDSYCPSYAASGECEYDPERMLSICPLACGFCNYTEEEQDEERMKFLYVMSLYPSNTFEEDFKDNGYYCLPGAFRVWGSEEKFKASWEDILRRVMIILCCLHLVRLLAQIWTYHWEAFQPIFFIELALYILCMLLVLDLQGFDIVYTDEMKTEESYYVDLVNNFQKETGLRQNWQWQCGSMALFLSWMNLLMYIQKIPYLGIYVVMFNDVFKTFVKFSLIFLLFILAFGFTFHTLLQNEVEFEFTFGSILKTAVMMLGEIDFAGVFIGGESYEDTVNYVYVTYVVFVLFMIIMMIIIMNLLVGLAVGDIIAVQESAALSRLKMQVELALEVEFTVPNFIRKRLVRKSHHIHPNQYRRSNKIKRFLFENKHLSTKKIVGAITTGKSDTEEIRETVQNVSYEIRELKMHYVENESILRQILKQIDAITGTGSVTGSRKSWATEKWSRSITPRMQNSPSLEIPQFISQEPMNKEEASVLLAPPTSLFGVVQRAQDQSLPPTICLDFDPQHPSTNNTAASVNMQSESGDMNFINGRNKKKKALRSLTKKDSSPDLKVLHEEEERGVNLGDCSAEDYFV